MKIGELASRAGCQVETVRFYEREGLLPPPARSAGNYRQYGESHMARLQFIRHCRSFDISLDEIRTLLRLRDSPTENCCDADEILDRHILQIAERIGQLRQLQQQLEQLRGTCSSPQAAGECGILHGLETPTTISGQVKR